MSIIKIVPLLLVLVGLITIFFGINWYNNNVAGPKAKKRLMKSGPLAELTRWGFKPIDNAFSGELLGGAAKVPLAFIGTVGGYDVEASYTWDNEGYLIVRVFFEPVNRDYDAVMHAWHTQRLSVKKWKFGKGLFNPVMLFSAPVYVDASIPYGNSLPEVKASKLISLAEQIVQGLQGIGRLPINYFDGSELANNIIQESKSRNEIRKLKRQIFSYLMG